jgi:hypothetical protein
MTSSATKTERAAAKAAPKQPLPEAPHPGDGEDETDARHAGISRDGAPRRRAALTGVAWLGWATAGVLILSGWFMVLMYNRWHFGPPTVFLMFGWAAVIGTGWFLSRAGWMAANDDPAVTDDFWEDGLDGQTLERNELEHEKRSLLKAIKEIEFDHQLGKMSDEDAKQLIQTYRARAIDVIKALDAVTDETTLSVKERIEREVRARLAVENAAVDAAAKQAKAAVAKTEVAKAEVAKAEAANAEVATATEPAAPEAVAEPETKPETKAEEPA